MEFYNLIFKAWEVMALRKWLWKVVVNDVDITNIKMFQALQIQ